MNKVKIIPQGKEELKEHSRKTAYF